MKLTSSSLRKIIAEEVAAVTQARGDSTRGVESLMTPEEELALARAARRPTPATPKGSFEEFEAGYSKRGADRRWTALSASYPKLTKRVGRAAFEDELASRATGAAGGGSSLGPADEYRILLDLLEEEA